MLSGGADGKIVVWKTKGWTKLHILGSHKYRFLDDFSFRAAVLSIAIHPSNKVAISVGADNTMRLWNLVKGRIGFVRKLKERANKILFSPDCTEYFLLFATSVVAPKVADGEELLYVQQQEGINDLAILKVSTPYL